jgi:ACDE family multidrug resistance protein
VQKVSLAAPIKALRHRGLLAAGIVALFYNFGFFTLLAYTPFPLHLGARELGYVFFGWGMLVAIFSVLVAPAVKRRLGTVGTLAAVFALYGADLLAMALGIGSQTTLILCVIVAGAFIGVVNTVLTEAVMKVAPVERPIASSAYSFLRFGGGALAPWLAGRLAEEIAPDTPYFVGAGAVAIALVPATGPARRDRGGRRSGAAGAARGDPRRRRRDAGVVMLGEAHHGRHALTHSLSGRDGVELIVVAPEEAAA